MWMKIALLTFLTVEVLATPVDVNIVGDGEYGEKEAYVVKLPKKFSGEPDLEILVLKSVLYGNNKVMPTHNRLKRSPSKGDGGCGGCGGGGYGPGGGGGGGYGPGGGGGGGFGPGGGAGFGPGGGVGGYGPGGGGAGGGKAGAGSFSSSFSGSSSGSFGLGGKKG